MSGSNFLTTGAALANNADLNRKLQYEKEWRNRDWSNLPSSHKLYKFCETLPEILREAGHNEMYGVELVAGSPPPHTTMMILQKYLRANEDCLESATKHLTAVLKWRKEFQPWKLRDEVFDQERFQGLGYVIKATNCPATLRKEDAVCFILYGAAAQDLSRTLGDYEAFFRWRVALQEISLQMLDLASSTQIIPDHGHGLDPYKAVLVHDYQPIHSLRQLHEIRSVSKKIEDDFRTYYPETTALEYHVNVPALMQHAMGVVKGWSTGEDVQSKTWLSNGGELNKYLGDSVCEVYGGHGRPLEEIGVAPSCG